MISGKVITKCRRIRKRLAEAFTGGFRFEAEWVQNHIASCPKCQRRFAAIGRVNLAIQALKSQPQKLDLLMQANSRAIKVLKHALREAPKADSLKHALPEPRMLEKCAACGRPLLNAAACLAIVFLIRIGVFSSITHFREQGQKAIKGYYTKNLGRDIADEFFSA
jgi:anti-sigma factor RsiW